MLSCKAVFPGFVFAAVGQRTDIALHGNVRLYVPENEETRKRLVADLRFMKFSERLNTRYPFSWEKEFPGDRDVSLLHDRDGFGNLFVKKTDSNTRLWFYFQIVKKILSFTLSSEDFRKFQDVSEN